MYLGNLCYLGENMKITVETKYGKYTHEYENDDCDIYEMLDHFKDMSLAMSYHPDSWDNAIMDVYDALPESVKQEQIDYNYTKAECSDNEI